MSVTRERNPKGKGDQLRVDLLDAAADLMGEHGTVEGVTLRAVAARAGVSPTAVYRHFDNHDELLREAVDHCWSEFGNALASASYGEDAFANFRAMGDAYVDFAVNDRGKYRVLFSGTIDLDHNPIGKGTFDMLIAQIAQLLELNDDPRDPFQLAVQVHTWIHGIVDLCEGHPDMPWPEISDQLDWMSEALGLLPRDTSTSG